MEAKIVLGLYKNRSRSVYGDIMNPQRGRNASLLHIRHYLAAQIDALSAGHQTFANWAAREVYEAINSLANVIGETTQLQGRHPDTKSKEVEPRSHGNLSARLIICGDGTVLPWGQQITGRPDLYEDVLVKFQMSTFESFCNGLRYNLFGSPTAPNSFIAGEKYTCVMGLPTWPDPAETQAE
jgi:hypothetical protein